MSFKPEMQRAIDYYAAMTASKRAAKIKNMLLLQSALCKCLAAARRAEKDAKNARRVGAGQETG